MNNNTNYNELKKEVGAINSKNGLHNKEYSSEHFITLILSELYEAMEAERLNRMADIGKYIERLSSMSYSIEELTTTLELSSYNDKRLEIFERNSLYYVFIKGTIEEELADAFLRTMDIAYIHNIDLEVCNTKPLTGDYMTEDIYIITTDILSNATSLSHKVNLLASYIIQLANKHNVELSLQVRFKLDYNKLSYKPIKKY